MRIHLRGKPSHAICEEWHLVRKCNRPAQNYFCNFLLFTSLISHYKLPLFLLASWDMIVCFSRAFSKCLSVHC